jgi:hypothetical protein
MALFNFEKNLGDLDHRSDVVIPQIKYVFIGK